MATQKKHAIVSDLSEKLSRAKAIVFTDYRGLNTTQLQELRRKTEETGGLFKITKNTLLKLSGRKTGLTNLLANEEILRGPTATLFCFQDEIKPIQALVTFSEEWELPLIKGGILQKNFLNPDQVMALSKIPDRKLLLSQLTTVIYFPIIGLVNALAANLRRLPYVLNVLKTGKNQIQKK